jgi:hypothetical protein
VISNATQKAAVGMISHQVGHHHGCIDRG